jgi:hypothetical protein
MEWLQRLDGTRIAVLAVVVLAVLALLRKLFAGVPESRHTAPGRCSCGWVGTVSRHAPRCPRCGEEMTV